MPVQDSLSPMKDSHERGFTAMEQVVARGWTVAEWKPSGERMLARLTHWDFCRGRLGVRPHLG